MERKKIRIGDLLVQEGVITDEQLQHALSEQKKTGRKLGRQLIDLGFTTEDQMLDLLSQQLKVPRININDYSLSPEVARNLPETHARRFRALVIEDTGQDYLVAMADPSDLFAYDEICRNLGKPVRVAVLREGELLSAIDNVYRRTEEISNLAEELGEEMGSEDDIDLSTLPVGDDQSGAPVVRLLRSIFEDAVQVGASDIHIEPDEKALRLRLRVDGVLQEQIVQQRNVLAALVSRLKLMCGLNISERRLPQDGRFQVRVQGRSIDVRLSTLPLQYGEAVVMRLLDHSSGVGSLDEIGMPPHILERFRRLIHTPNGLVLITGPTGSGKSTTLYGALSEINQPGVKIITVEDPVEYRLPRVNQVQAREEIGLTFARVLRTALRQDPDIVMVGEMRDEETAEIGMRAAVTGHLVFSTLHTNDAVATANRLMDMGVEPYMLAAALRAIVAQRLLRRICTHCREEHVPDPRQKSWLEMTLGSEEAERITLYRGRGCHQCNRTGYSGRIGVFELLELDADMVDALRRGDQSAFAHACQRSDDYQPMSHVALDYARQGVTTLDEVFRVLGEVDETVSRDQSRSATRGAGAQGAAPAGETETAQSGSGGGVANQARSEQESQAPDSPDGLSLADEPPPRSRGGNVPDWSA